MFGDRFWPDISSFHDTIECQLQELHYHLTSSSISRHPASSLFSQNNPRPFLWWQMFLTTERAVWRRLSATVLTTTITNGLIKHTEWRRRRRRRWRADSTRTERDERAVAVSGGGGGEWRPAGPAWPPTRREGHRDRSPHNETTSTWLLSDCLPDTCRRSVASKFITIHAGGRSRVFCRLGAWRLLAAY